jgi:hypothetical protein
MAGTDEVLAIGQPIERVVTADGRGERFGEVAGLPSLPPQRVMWRAELYRALQDQAVAQCPAAAPAADRNQ